MRGQQGQLSQVAIGLLGRHQAANASVAIATCGQLRRQGWRLDESTIRWGIGRAHCPARIEILSQSPTVILDTAHNPASIAALMELILERFCGGPRLLVFATSTDKDAPTMLQQLLPHFQHVVFTRYLNNPRATDPDKLLAIAQSIQQSRGLSQLTLHLPAEPGSGLAVDRVAGIPGSSGVHHRVILPGRRSAAVRGSIGQCDRVAMEMFR